MMRIAVISIFPDMMDAVSCFGITGKAVEAGLLDIKLYNPRDYSADRHRNVDDRPYGGGPGMVMRVEPMVSAIRDARKTLEYAEVIYLSPQGRQLDQDAVRSFSGNKELILVTGRYEGIDERIIEAEIDQEWSIGDYVLSGGELPAMVLIDAVVRMLPGALGHEDSAEQDSFASGLLDCPHYTRPETVEEMQVPEVLMNGNHREIERWRLKQKLGRTSLRRPDLLEKLSLDEEQQGLLDAFMKERSMDGK